ncbi:MAG: flagellar hook-associated protein FlgK [Rubrivivax sp.]|nr:flagellar hook-associated protein FlgK [Rubrivivax sp.]
MSIGLKAMVSNYSALQTTGHNIANASVEGYSRQQVELSTATGQFTGAGFFGKGVNVDTVTRAHSSHLTREASNTRSLAAMDQTRHEALKDLEAVFPMGETGIGYAAGQFLNAAVDLASRPSDLSARQVVLARAQEAAGRFAAAADQLDSLQANVGEQIGATVDTINSLARNIGEVNQRIASLKGLGQPPNDLLDERDRLVARLSEHVQVTTIPAEDGTLGVFVAGGQRLVLGHQASPLRAVPDPEDSSRKAIAIDDSGQLRVLTDGSLGGGALAGLLRFQNDDLVSARAQLGQMAAAFAAAVNTQQSLGLDLRDPPGAGAPLFANGPAQVLPNADNQRTPSGGFLAQPSISVTDATQLVASEYELRADPGGAAGAWQLTRRSDGLVRTVADGDTVDGFRLTVGSPAPVANDRFLLQPVSRMAVGMRTVLSDPRGLAAASPVTATLSPSNRGTAGVASLTVVSSAVNPDHTANLSFTSDTGDYNWELRDRVSNALISSGTGTWSAGNPVALNGFELQLSGVPRNGDALSVARTAFPGANNGNALSLVALRDRPLVGQTVQSNGQLGGGRTLNEAYASVMADVGVRVQGARVSSEVSATVAAQAELARSSASGVNLDEEAARLLAFQQSYQAAAKVLQVAQAVFDTLLQTART